MKKFISVLLAVLTFATLLPACGQPTDTTAPDVTDTPETNAPVTDAPAPDGGSDIPDDPTFNPDEEQEEPKTIVFEYNFEGLDASGIKNIENFPITADGWEVVPGENGYIKNTAANDQLAIKDEKLALSGKSFVFEADVTFTVLPHKAEGVTNFPLSVLSWIRKSTKTTFYDWLYKLDDGGYFYIKDTDTRTDIKIEANKKYTLGVFIDDANSGAKIMIDGNVVATRSFSTRDAITSTLRIFDSGDGKAHFNANVHAARVYLADDNSLLKDAERDVFTAMSSYTSPALCFVGYTDKDALSYKVGEEMTFEIYLTCNGEVVSAPYFYYSVKGEDGQPTTEGYADGSKGHFTVKAKMSKPGAVRVEALVCDENKVKQTKNNSNLYVNLETTTPQKANLSFKGGAIAGFEEITAGGRIPSDLETYWNGVVKDCYKGDIKLLRFDELDPANYGGSASKHSLYLVEIECASGFVTGYLSVPKNKETLGLRCSFVSYGAAKKPKPSFYDNNALFAICAHSYHLDDPNASVQEKYGFDNTENQNRDTIYFKNMFIRNITATRFLKAYIGDTSYGKIVYNGKTVAPLNKWKKGDYYMVSGGSQASFQSVAMAAMDSDVTEASFGVPWFCDIGGDLVGRFSGWNPDYTDALMYYDSCALATLIEDDVKVTITAGLGDTTSEPSGVVALYNALNCKTTMTMYQNREHTYNPPIPKTYKVSKD